MNAILEAARRRHAVPSMDADEIGKIAAHHAQGCDHKLGAFLDAIARAARLHHDAGKRRDPATDARRAGL